MIRIVIQIIGKIFVYRLLILYSHFECQIEEFVCGKLTIIAIVISFFCPILIAEF